MTECGVATLIKPIWCNSLWNAMRALPFLVALCASGVSAIVLPHTERAFLYTNLDEIDRSGPTSTGYSKVFKESFRFNSTSLPNVTFDIGEAYAGQLPVLPLSDDRKESYNKNEDKLFFIHVPSQNQNASDEIVIWLNGGPGCSSVEGFWQENGPISWKTGTYNPVYNPFGWNNLTNMVWIDQPVGTGYSTGNMTATSEEDISDAFLSFWKNFVDVFGLQGRKVYLTGESYAGKYIPYIGDAMLQEEDTDYYNLKGALVYSPYIAWEDASEAPARYFIRYHQQLFPFSSKVQDEFDQLSKACRYDELVSEALQFPPKQQFFLQSPSPAGNETEIECDILDDILEEIFKLNPCFNIYKVSETCPLLWDTLGFPSSDEYVSPDHPELYFNRTEVKETLHAPVDINWSLCGSNTSPPAGANGGPLARVIEGTNNVIIAHGILDMVLLANATLLTLNNLTWNGNQGFSQGPHKTFYVPFHPDPQPLTWSGGGEFGRWTSDRGLTFVEINLSGHMVPMHQPGAGYRTLEALLQRVPDLSTRGPFSTQTSEGDVWDDLESLLVGNDTSLTEPSKHPGKGKERFKWKDFLRR